MKIQFFGANGTVTGSRHMLTTDGHSYLIDCGLFQGTKHLRLRNWSPLPFYAGDLSGVLLTHAHIDHSGYLPVLIKQGFRGKIYATPATIELCTILLPDAGHLQEEDAAYANREGFSRHKEALPLFTAEDARKTINYFEPVERHELLHLNDETTAEFISAGHILGSSMVRFRIGNTTLIYTGDMGRMSSLTMNPPEMIQKSDYLILESTYGNRKHSHKDPETEIQAVAERTLSRGGRLLIPAFAVGRSQQILYILHRLMKKNRLPDIPVYLDSPMAIAATELFCRYSQEQALDVAECNAMVERTRLITDPEDSRRLVKSDAPAIVLSASGMATGGRVLHHIRGVASDPRNTILFVGYQSKGTRGDSIVNGKQEIKIHGQQIPIRCEVVSMESLSAHPDPDETIAWLQQFRSPPKRVYLTHGEQEASEAMKIRIEKDLGWDCVIPEYTDSYDL